MASRPARRRLIAPGIPPAPVCQPRAQWTHGLCLSGGIRTGYREQVPRFRACCAGAEDPDICFRQTNTHEKKQACQLQQNVAAAHKADGVLSWARQPPAIRHTDAADFGRHSSQLLWRVENQGP